MEQQASQWVTLGIALATGSFFLLRNVRPAKERRSMGQASIHLLYRTVRFFWAVVRAVDIGYLEYRRVLTQMPLEIENERQFGKLIRPAEDAASERLNWRPAD
ncbi:MAG: hypothetical protein ACRD6B_03250 [Bryobacteraceae bacterium]